jgi:hypothetical protein
MADLIPGGVADLMSGGVAEPKGGVPYKQTNTSVKERKPWRSQFWLPMMDPNAGIDDEPRYQSGSKTIARLL